MIVSRKENITFPIIFFDWNNILVPIIEKQFFSDILSILGQNTRPKLGESRECVFIQSCYYDVAKNPSQE